jgi:hypothetical protein
VDYSVIHSFTSFLSIFFFHLIAVNDPNFSQLFSTFFRRCFERQKELHSQHVWSFVHKLRINDIIQVWLSLQVDLKQNLNK